jgi:hypothetical protein
MPKPIQATIFGEQDIPEEHREDMTGWDTPEQAMRWLHDWGVEFYQVVDLNRGGEVVAGTMWPQLWSGLMRRKNRAERGA